MKVVQNGNRCLEYLFSSTYDGDNSGYDIIILDTHLRDISGFEVAQKDSDELPNKRIILTTTYPLNNIKNIIDSIGIKSEDMFLKPFSFSKLFSILKEPIISYN